MPIYEYACKACGEHLEVAQSFRDEPLTTCPGCGGALRKVFGSIGIAFKGSGFYRTDSRPAGGGDGRRPKEAEGKDKAGEKAKDKAGEKAKGGSGEASKGASSGEGGSGSSGGSSGGSSSSSGKAEARSA